MSVDLQCTEKMQTIGISTLMEEFQQLWRKVSLKKWIYQTKPFLNYQDFNARLNINIYWIVLLKYAAVNWALYGRFPAASFANFWVWKPRFEIYNLFGMFGLSVFGCRKKIFIKSFSMKRRGWDICTKKKVGNVEEKWTQKSETSDIISNIWYFPCINHADVFDFENPKWLTKNSIPEKRAQSKAE